MDNVYQEFSTDTNAKNIDELMVLILSAKMIEEDE
ncbi:hypothetical protein JOC73_002192 [Alkaliphilus hydrothermalis]|uniref:Uncharacterized protein n=1 Tax=Alkaliphilus hydrothermalis TaxID=1482730 RepID=A0ABS2NRM2_9FIRM|nr:hypothetical protein [Alkaliphilus hydrothermalis]